MLVPFSHSSFEVGQPELVELHHYTYEIDLHAMLTKQSADAALSKRVHAVNAALSQRSSCCCTGRAAPPPLSSPPSREDQAYPASTVAAAARSRRRQTRRVSEERRHIVIGIA